MCGIVGAVAERNITPILVEGLKRLEYRGYDSAGVATVDSSGRLDRRRAVGKLVNLSESAHIERELMLVKVKATGAQRAEVKRTTDIFRGQIVDVTSSVYTIQLAGTSDKLDSFIQAIGTASILETVRSGVTGIARGDKVLSI